MNQIIKKQNKTETKKRMLFQSPFVEKTDEEPSCILCASLSALRTAVRHWQRDSYSLQTFVGYLLSF